ncbi:hypothetical protein FB446DRAFT_776363 [Lentinula raphanica]|nr:hypothetical protein FB446DRAFT_776363 [Lentinula raphanica]
MRDQIWRSYDSLCEAETRRQSIKSGEHSNLFRLNSLLKTLGTSWNVGLEYLPSFFLQSQIAFKLVLFVVGTISSAAVAAPAGPPTAPSIRTLSTKASHLVPSQSSAKLRDRLSMPVRSTAAVHATILAAGEDDRDRHDERCGDLEVNDSHGRNGETEIPVPSASSELATSKLN